jgi:glutaredoxin 3
MLSLYYKPTCPYCQKVFEETESLNVDFDLRDVSEEDEARTELLEKGGKQQVPFLVDTERNVSMYESDDIIAYVKEHYDNSGAPKKPRIHVNDSVCTSGEG